MIPDMMTPVVEEDMGSDEPSDMGMPMLGDIAPPDTETNVNGKESEGCDANGQRGSSTGALFILLLLGLISARRFNIRVA
jgi:hypothetical protein